MEIKKEIEASSVPEAEVKVIGNNFSYQAWK